MKTETQATKEMIKHLNSSGSEIAEMIRENMARIHLKTCKRMLERLENTNPKKFPSETLLEKLIDRIIKDLREANFQVLNK